MEPRRYLLFGLSLILLTLLAVVAISLVGHGLIKGQYDRYSSELPESLALQEMRIGAGRIVSSANELALIGLAKSFGAEKSSEDKDNDEIGGQGEELDLIAQGREKFEIGLADLRKFVAGRGSRDEEEIHQSNYYALLVASDALLKAIEKHEDASAILKRKEEQEAAEKQILTKIDDHLASIKSRVAIEESKLESLLELSRNLIVASAILAMIIACAIGIIVYCRITYMFEQISIQKKEIETAHHDLRLALDELKSLQKTLLDNEKLATLGKLTATVSHELRNPLGALRNVLFIVREVLGDDVAMKPHLDMGERSIKRCDNIIGDLLEFTRTNILALKTTDLSNWVRSVLAEQRLSAGITLVDEMDDPGPQVDIDDDRFRRVVINLLENAMHAIKGQGSTGTITVRTGSKGGRVVLTIQDDGPGIPADVLPKIFEPLFTTKSFGAGLGLPTAMRLVEQHGGRMTVDPAAGRGTIFSITLPAGGGLKQEAA